MVDAAQHATTIGTARVIEVEEALPFVKNAEAVALSEGLSSEFVSRAVTAPLHWLNRLRTDDPARLDAMLQACRRRGYELSASHDALNKANRK